MTKKKTSGTRKLKKAKAGSTSLIKKQKNLNSLNSIKNTLPKIGKIYDYLNKANDQKKDSLVKKGSKKLRDDQEKLKKIHRALNKIKLTLKKYKSTNVGIFSKALNNNVKSVDRILSNEPSNNSELSIDAFERKIQKIFIDTVLNEGSGKGVRKAKNADIFKQDYKNALIGIKNFLLLFMDDKDDINYNLDEKIFKNYDDNVRNPSKGSRYSLLKGDSLKTILESLKTHKVNNNIRDSDIETINSILNNIQRDIKEIPFGTKFLFFPDVEQSKAKKLAIKKFLKLKNKIDSGVDEIISKLGCNIEDLFRYYYGDNVLNIGNYEYFTKHILPLLPTINTDIIIKTDNNNNNNKISHSLILSNHPSNSSTQVIITDKNRIMMTLLHAVYRLKFLLYINDNERDQQIYTIKMNGNNNSTPISIGDILYDPQYSLVPV